MKIQVSVSLGELVDKITILRIKSKKISDKEKLSFVHCELKVLEESIHELNLNEDKMKNFLNDLEAVNTELWEIEDRIREKEQRKSFDEEFINLARKVYITNDKRFLIKNNCNETFGSVLKEVKSYEKYD